MSAIKQGGWTSEHDGHGGVYIGDADGRQIGFISNRRDQDEIAAFIVSAPELAASHQRLKEALAGALHVYDRETCTHEETHRGGAIWTICDHCDQKWADDRGGFQPYKDPPQIAAAREALRSAP